MKKTAVIITIIAAGIALLFAQTPTEAQPETPAGDTSLKAADMSRQPVAPKPGTGGSEAKTKTGEPELSDKPTTESEPPKTDEAGLSEEGPSEDALITEGRISLRLKEVELKKVVEIFSRLSNANIIVPDLDKDKKVDRSIDVNLDNVEWKPALEAILETQELELYEKIPGTKVYAIRKKEPGAPEAVNVQVFKLNYASVNSVTSIVERLVGETGSYSVFPERNVVVAQGTAKALLSVGAIIKQIDLPRQQVFIEAKFLELTDKAQRDLGVNWQVLEAYSLKASNLGMDYKKTDTSTTTDSRFLDIAGRPYEALTEEPVGGVIEWAARPGNPAGDVRILNMTPTQSDIEELAATKALTAVLGADDFELILSALEQKDGVDLVSNPKIIVANEEEALIHLGQKEPNIRIERTAGTTDNPGGSISVGLDKDLPYFEDGVKVVVRPTINTASNIMVRIVPELTSFVGRKSVQASGTSVEYPISLTKKVETVFSLESGQTAAIGGLTQTKESLSENKIPWLGNIPFVGRLFSYKQTILDQNETIIFVTVGLANPSSIDMETGLPTRTRLAQRYQIREAADLRIAKEEARLLQTKEKMAMKKELEDLREANRQLIEKQKAKALAAEVAAPVAEEMPAVEGEPVGTQEPAPVTDSSSIALATEEAQEATEENSGGGDFDVDVTETE